MERRRPAAGPVAAAGADGVATVPGGRRGQGPRRAARRILAEDVVLHSPVTFKPFEGRAGGRPRAAHRRRGLRGLPLRGRASCATGCTTRSSSRPASASARSTASTWCATRADGLIDDITVFIRPLSGLSGAARRDGRAARRAAGVTHRLPRAGLQRRRPAGQPAGRGRRAGRPRRARAGVLVDLRHRPGRGDPRPARLPQRVRARSRPRWTPRRCSTPARTSSASSGGTSARPRHAPRPLDVDLLLLGDEAYRSERLTLPHAQVTERRFVLIPLVELDPEPVTPAGVRLADRLAELPSTRASGGRPAARRARGLGRRRQPVGREGAGGHVARLVGEQRWASATDGRSSTIARTSPSVSISRSEEAICRSAALGVSPPITPSAIQRVDLVEVARAARAGRRARCRRRSRVHPRARCA